MHEVENPDEDDLWPRCHALLAWRQRFNKAATHHRLRLDRIGGVKSPVQDNLHEDRAGQASYGSTMSMTIQYVWEFLCLHEIRTHNKATRPPISTAPEDWYKAFQSPSEVSRAAAEKRGRTMVVSPIGNVGSLRRATKRRDMHPSRFIRIRSLFSCPRQPKLYPPNSVLCRWCGVRRQMGAGQCQESTVATSATPIHLHQIFGLETTRGRWRAKGTRTIPWIFASTRRQCNVTSTPTRIPRSSAPDTGTSPTTSLLLYRL